nr:PREDICTED: rap guanine nucleotide exchange factor 5 [Opisthocomus hoazin]
MAVQRELAAVIALKARKSVSRAIFVEFYLPSQVYFFTLRMTSGVKVFFPEDLSIHPNGCRAIHQNEENSSQEIRGLEELKDTSDAQAGVLCKLQGRDDIGRIELVQKLARENCQFLQADRKPSEKAEQTIYRNVLDDVYEYPILEKDLKEFQKILGMHRRHTVDEYSPHRKNKTFFHQFSLKENWLQHRGTMNETEEIFCRVYITEHSYVSVKAQISTSAQEILKIVAEKIQHAEEELALVTVTFSGEKRELQPNDLAISKSFESSSRMFVYRKDLTDSLNPFAENEELQQKSVRILGINTWDLALELTNFDWSLFNAIHEQELIYFTFSRQGSAENTENLSLLLQRCNEVQLWVATEILLCSQLCKRVQLVKKFIKIAAHCKAQRNLNSFFAIVMGLNTASVSRLSQTWEKIPGKFKKLFTELESLTDPSLNHKAYRDAFKKMKSPKIPFMPLLLKDVTFIHEGNKTFLDNLVNFEKLHMIADTVRSLRHCRNNQFGNEVSSKEHHELKPYVHHLYVIDNQQALFELSHRIEPRV